jgi:hypothetical protein
MIEKCNSTSEENFFKINFASILSKTSDSILSSFHILLFFLFSFFTKCLKQDYKLKFKFLNDLLEIKVNFLHLKER